MSRWADWFAMDLAEVARFRAASASAIDPDGQVGGLLQPWLDRAAELSLHVEMDKAWEPIHRCLTNDHGSTYDFNPKAGSRPLNLCVLGGELLLQDGYRSIALVCPEDVAALATALLALHEDWFRERFFGLPDNQFHEIDEESFEWTWEHFRLLPPFFSAAAQAGHAVVCTISH